MVGHGAALSQYILLITDVPHLPLLCFTALFPLSTLSIGLTPRRRTCLTCETPTSWWVRMTSQRSVTSTSQPCCTTSKSASLTRSSSTLIVVGRHSTHDTRLCALSALAGTQTSNWTTFKKQLNCRNELQVRVYIFNIKTTVLIRWEGHTVFITQSLASVAVTFTCVLWYACHLHS